MADETEEPSLGKVIAENWTNSWLLCKLAFAVGAVLLLAALALEGFGEYQGMAKAQSLEKGAGQVATVAGDKVDPVNEGKLVHVVGEAQTKETLADPEFDVSANAIRLSRKVEVYQWQEKKEFKKKGKETVVSYHYDLIWSAKLLDSSKYNDRSHDNPTSLPFAEKTWEAREVTCGAFKLSPGLVKQIANDERLPAEDKGKLPEKVKAHSDGLYYRAEDPTKPVAGDARIEFKAVKPGTVSVVAKQVGNGLEAYQDDSGHATELLQVGTHGADAMFAQAQAKAGTLTWGFRGLGFFLMIAALYLIFTPKISNPDSVPLVGAMLPLGGVAFAVLAALALSMVVSGVMLVTHQPVVSVPLLLGAAGVVFVGRVLGVRKLAKDDGSDKLPGPAAKVARKIRSRGGRVNVYGEGNTMTVSVTLEGKKFTDESLADLDDLPTVSDLYLSNTSITGTGLVGFQKAKALQSLSVRGQLTEKGLQAIGTLAGLKKLSLSEVKVSDQSLALLKGLARLEEAELSETLVTDAGLVHLRGWVSLQKLQLSGAPITGAGLDHCKDLKQLREVWVSNTKLTDAGMAGLKNLKGLKQLWVGINQINGQGLGYLQGLTQLEQLDVSNSNVNDKGLAFIQKLPALKELNLERTKVSDACLAFIKAMPALEKLELYRNAISDKGVVQLAGKATLKELCIDRTQVTDACMPAIAKLPNLEKLHLDYTGVTDAGLVHLKTLQRLFWVTLKGTKVTRKGIDDLKGALPNADIDNETGWRGMIDEMLVQQEEQEAKKK